MNFGSGEAIVWDGPIRGTSAGDALFRFYNGLASHKQSGQSLDSRLDVLRRFVMAGERPATVPHRKVPRYRRRIDSDNLAVFPIDGGRRKASYILEKIKEDLADAGLPAPPARAVMDSKEKQRLQTIFEWSGFDGKMEDLAPKIAPVPRVVKGSKEEKEHLMDTSKNLLENPIFHRRTPRNSFSAVAREIDERETFLKEMEKFGTDRKYRGQIRWEIQDRLNQMKQLDRLISEDDANLLTKKVIQRHESHNSKKAIQWRR